MKWISFKKKLPPSLEDVLIWDNDEAYGQIVSIGFLSEKEETAKVSCPECCSDCNHVIEGKGIVLKYYYTGFQDHFTVLLKDVLNRDFYWMPVPEFKI